MPDIQITDQLDQPIDSIKIDPSHPSSLFKYLKSQLLHLAVFPDFLALKDKLLSQAAPSKPIEFQAKAQHQFQLGNTKPEIDITPSAQATIGVNATPGTDFFGDSDAFQVPATVPPHTAYVSLGFQGSLDLGVSGSDGDLTFGVDKTATLSFAYAKAFPLGAGEPTLLDGLSQTMSSFSIPADISDLAQFAVNDIATVSGQGALKVSGSFSVATTPNPLASVNLPLAGALAFNAGASAGVSATLSLTGSYQIRARRKDADTIELSFLRDRNASFKADFSAAAGFTATLGNSDTDLIGEIFGAISSDPEINKKLLTDLTAAEIQTLSGAIKDGLQQSLQASLDAVLSASTDNTVAFQYEIQPARLSAAASAAVHRALDGDLRQLTLLEATAQPGGVLAPGVKLLNSVFSAVRKRGLSLTFNLLGILNFESIAQFIHSSEILTDAATGDVTIKETVTGNRISAIVEPLARNEAVRKAIFDSVLMTTSYRAGKALASSSLQCSQMHFALNQNTNQQIMGDYLRAFMALNLLSTQDQAAILAKFSDGGPSTCILRTAFGDPDCAAMFFDAEGRLRSKENYLEIGRRALRALLDPAHQAIDQLREQILSDALWSKTLQIGPNGNLGPLVGLSVNDPQVRFLIGDLFVIIGWAGAMVRAGALVQDLRSFVGSADPATLINDNTFKTKRGNLQNAMASIVKESTIRFDEPWGLVSLFWAGGSPQTAYGKATTAKLIVERGSKPALAAGAAGD